MYTPPSLTEIKTQIQSSISSSTGDSVPAYEKSFYAIMATVLALLLYPVYKFISWNYNQSFVRTCDEDHLEGYHGLDENVTRSYATKYELLIEMVVTSPAVISIATTFENPTTGLFYFPIQEKSVTVTDNTINIIADGYGTEYALSAGDEIEISGSQIDGVSSLCTVSSVVVYGVDKQSLDSYRSDVLEAKTGSTGGSTASDYRRRGQSVPGVKRIFPYSGRPYEIEEALPGDRSIFVEGDHEMFDEGVPDSDLIDAVTNAMVYNDETGQEEVPLGSTTDTLIVSPVRLVYFTIYINNLVVDATVESALKTSISGSVSDYLKTLSPYVQAIDPEYERNDNISSVSISGFINDLLKQYSATASSISVYESGVGLSDNRLLIGGDLARLNTVLYVG